MTLQLLTSPTPNGQKISIFLSELHHPYTATPISLSAGEQKHRDFLATNPNGRIPAIIDHARSSFPVFESGAILLYLVEHYDKRHAFSFADPNKHSEMVQWLFWQNAGLGPMQGQANHFVRYAPERIGYAVERYQNEVKRLYAVLEARLEGREYLVGGDGGKYSVADISCFTWVRWAPWAGIDLEEFPRLRGWVERIEKREAVQKGLKVPEGEDQIEKLRRDPNVDDPFKEWVQQGQREVAEKHGK